MREEKVDSFQVFPWYNAKFLKLIYKEIHKGLIVEIEIRCGMYLNLSIISNLR